MIWKPRKTTIGLCLYLEKEFGSQDKKKIGSKLAKRRMRMDGYAKKKL